MAAAVAQGLDRKMQRRLKQGLSEEMLYAVRDVFQTFESGTGILDVNSLRAALKSLDHPISHQEAKNLVHDLDQDGCGGIQFYQFAEYLKPILLMDDMRTKIESYFDEFAEVLLEDDVSEPTSDTQKRYLT
mmetsp:Transcript_10924/g.36886  ORF Transcript_10924/g.36886 Transcript_10924/m.36886 type:complete len:131 (+) Transcript_10924:81-473(+)